MSSSEPGKRSSGGRPTLEASAVLADRILETAWRMFLQNGYKQLSIDGIAKEAGVSKRTIYDRFESKLGLFETLLTRASDHWASQTGEVFQEHIENDWLKPLILHIFDTMWSPDYMALISFLITEGHAFPEVMAKRRVNYQISLTAFAEHVGGRIENYPKGEEGRLLARSVLAIIGGWARQFGLDEPAQDAPLYRERVWREVRGILDLYGCKGLIELADDPAKT